MSATGTPKILDAVQECSGLMIRVKRGKRDEWIRPPEKGISREEAERLIEEQGIKVSGRLDDGSGNTVVLRAETP